VDGRRRGTFGETCHRRGSLEGRRGRCREMDRMGGAASNDVRARRRRETGDPSLRVPEEGTFPSETTPAGNGDPPTAATTSRRTTGRHAATRGTGAISTDLRRFERRRGTAGCRGTAARRAQSDAEIVRGVPIAAEASARGSALPELSRRTGDLILTESESEPPRLSWTWTPLIRRSGSSTPAATTA
jgi:hypothetical protein